MISTPTVPRSMPATVRDMSRGRMLRICLATLAVKVKIEKFIKIDAVRQV